MARNTPSTEPALPYDPVGVPAAAAFAAAWWRWRWRGASVVSRTCSRLLRSRECRLRIGDDELTIPFADPIAFLYLAGGVLNTRCVTALEQVLQPGAVVFDIGANYGLFGWQALRRVGPQGRVVFFEPNPVVAARLRQNLETNEVSNAVLIEKAVSECPGSSTLQVPPRGQSGLASLNADGSALPGWRPHPVECVSVDDFVSASGLRPTLLKIDVEGHELSVLRGAEETLQSCRPVLMLEMEVLAQDPGEGAAKELLTLLARHGYGHLYAASHTALTQITGLSSAPMCDLIASTSPLQLADCAPEA
jgi:FkbM family methyltransferase